MTILRARRLPVKPTRRAPAPLTPFAAGLDPYVPYDDHNEPAEVRECSPLPAIDGRGLTGAEFARIIAAERRAHGAYRIDVPDAGAKELDRLGAIAATDASGLCSAIGQRPPAVIRSRICPASVARVTTPPPGRNPR